MNGRTVVHEPGPRTGPRSRANVLVLEPSLPAALVGCRWPDIDAACERFPRTLFAKPTVVG